MIFSHRLAATVCLLIAAKTAFAGAPDPEALKKADTGDASACAQVAQACFDDSSGPADYAKAAQYARKAIAIDPATPFMQALLGLLTYQGRGVPMDRVAGRQLLEAAAARGDEGGRTLLAALNKHGNLGEQLAQAEPDPDVLTRAENGDADAQWALAEAYGNGWIVAPAGSNPARDWRDRAAENGSVQAQRFLASGYLNGTYGYAKDVPRGVRWLKRAADAGDASAQSELGQRFANGDGVPRDDAQAAAYLKRAIEAGDASARTPYAKLVAEGRARDDDPKQGVASLVSAEQGGDIDARRRLYEAAKAGEFTPVDAGQFRRLLEFGVKSGDTFAKTVLGIRLFTGEGIDADENAALPLLSDAADEGSADAAAALAQLYAKRANAQMHATGPLAAIQKQQAADSIAGYRHALVLFGRNGSTAQRAEAAKALTNFVMPSTQEGKAQLKSVGEDWWKALALVRIHRNEGGENLEALAWYDAVVAYMRENGMKTVGGQTADEVIAAQAKELQDFIRAHR